MEKYEQDLISKHIKTFTELRKLSIVFIEESKYHVEFLQELSHLDSIEVGFCRCKQNIDLEKLSSIENIKKIKLVETKTTDLIHLKKFKNLKGLYLYDIELQNLGELNIKKLKLINIDKVWVHDLDHISGLQNLESLTLNFNGTENIVHLIKLKGLTRLTRLNLISDYFTP
jgi:Leucine-rich repeat (LRR) protein